MTAKSKLRISPATVRDTIERLGPSYIKIGQYLALRPDLLPQEYCDELLYLVDSAPFFPFETARRIFFEDIGRDPFECFAEFDVTPVSVASLSQVYRAVTREGEVVAVKVQRPDLAAQVDKDFARARLLQPLIELFQVLPGVSEREALQQMREWMNEELDFELERRNMTHMRALLRDDPRVRIPRAFDHFSGRRVITMEYLNGISFSRLIRIARENNFDTIRELGIDRDSLAANLLRTCLDQTFRHRFFHADTHPGNIIAMPGDVIGFVDFGLTERLDAQYEPAVRRFVSSLYLRDIDGMVDAIMQVLIPSDNADPESFEAEFRDQHRVWLRSRAAGSSPDADWSLRNYMVGAMRAARRYGMRLPAGLLSMYRSLLTAETVARQIGASAGLMSTGQSFFEGLRLERFLDHFQPEEIRRALIPLLDFLEEPSGKYLRLLSDIADGTYVLPVESSESAVSRRGANHRARLVTAAIVLAAVSTLQAGSRGVMLAAHFPLSALLWILWCIVALWLVVLWRRLK